MNEKKITSIFNAIGLEVSFNSIMINLPRLFDAKYHLTEAHVYPINGEKNISLLMINEKRKGSIDRFIEQSIVLKEKLEMQICLVFTEISNDTRKLLLKARIPFLDYRGNLFLPELGMLLQENLDVVQKNSQKFSPSEQAILISILLYMEGNSIDLKEVEQASRVSVPTVYRTINKFIENGWINSGFNDYSLNRTRVEIFEEAKEHLNNPIDSVYYINDSNDEKVIHTDLSDFYFYNKLDSGMSALKSYTNIETDRDSFAISKKMFKNYLKRKTASKYYFDRHKIFNAVEVQVWNYEPLPDPNRHTVDPISLFYSLKNEDDPRISIEVDQLYKTIIMTMENNDAY